MKENEIHQVGTSPTFQSGYICAYQQYIDEYCTPPHYRKNEKPVTTASHKTVDTIEDLMTA